MRAPDPAEVRQRTRRCYAPGCGHPRSDHVDPIVEDGHCLVKGCACIGWDPMSADEWDAVYAAERARGARP